MKKILSGMAIAMVFGLTVSAAEYSWQKPYAKVLPQGDLEWAPEPFVFTTGKAVRFIDYEKGGDDRDGLTPATAWQHHPLDPAAKGQAKAGGGDTFVFKRGVAYRGALQGRLVGQPGQPIRLTSDPAWGTGEAMISGSEAVTGWRRGAGRTDLPESDKVWIADLEFAPRCVWMVAGGDVMRIPLARTPNWTVSDPRDVMGEWFVWEQPQWWTDQNKTKNPAGQTIHLGVDAKHLAGAAGDYVGGIVWSEWGIVMGTPFPSLIETFDAQQKGIGFQGFWLGDSGKIITGNRYFLEDKPNFLDAPGEFWFEKKGNGGRLYLRLPNDTDPNTVRVEAASRINLMDFVELRHVRISGLSFRFTNVFWDLTARQFVHKDVQPAGIRLYGSGIDLEIRNCTFAHVNKAIRLKAIADTDTLDRVLIADNDIHYTDHGAIEVEDSGRWAKNDPPFGEVGDVKILRNRLREIGHRAFRSDSSHALIVGFAETLEVAGNVLDRCYGAGIFCFGGKGSSETRDRPLTRMLIHHNKVTQPLLAANDWGGIETWQGGPAYVYNNISGDSGGYWNWAFGPDRPGNARLGFAYYLDGGFKNYHFNNIAWGRDNTLTSKDCNRCAFYQAVPAVLNAFFNNTVYKFAEGSGWSPAGGRQLFLGNVWSDISKEVFLHGKQKEDQNAVYDSYPFETIAYSRNIFFQVPATLANLEGSGSGDADLAKFKQAAAGKKLLAADVGTVATQAPLRDADNHDFRPAADGPSIDQGARVFVPWGLARMVGEWNFRRNQADPTSLLDEHWYMAPHVVDREKYRKLPRFDLTGVNITAASYTEGPLENWTSGALALNGRDQFLKLAAPAQTVVEEAPRGDTVTNTPADWLEVTTPRAMIPGRECKIDVLLKNPPAGQKLIVHLHWLKKQGWGGFNELARPFSIPVQGKGPYAFTVTPKEQPELDAFSVLVALTPTGEWKDQTANASVRVAAGEAPPPPVKDVPNPHQLDGNFLVEVYFRTEPGRPGGTLVSNLAERGYELAIDGNGRLAFNVRADTAARVDSKIAVNDGAWHHAIAECDRTDGALRLYLDGKLNAEAPAKLTGTVHNQADMLVGRSPSGNFWAGSIEFLRIALGTLAEAKTTIDELYAWQFDGPQYRDFTGSLPHGPRDAGALEAPEAP